MDVYKILQTLDFTSNKWVFIIPSVFMFLDFATGFINAWAKHNIKSAKMRTGLAKKFCEAAIIVCVAFMVEGMNIPKQVLTFTSGYVLLMEFISIIENAGSIGFKIPVKIKNKFDAFKE